jgi:hypothetical protein
MCENEKNSEINISQCSELIEEKTSFQNSNESPNIPYKSPKSLSPTYNAFSIPPSSRRISSPLFPCSFSNNTDRSSNSSIFPYYNDVILPEDYKEKKIDFEKRDYKSLSKPNDIKQKTKFYNSLNFMKTYDYSCLKLLNKDANEFGLNTSSIFSQRRLSYNDPYLSSSRNSSNTFDSINTNNGNENLNKECRPKSALLPLKKSFNDSSSLNSFGINHSNLSPKFTSRPSSASSFHFNSPSYPFSINITKSPFIHTNPRALTSRESLQRKKVDDLFHFNLSSPFREKMRNLEKSNSS